MFQFGKGCVNLWTEFDFIFNVFRMSCVWRQFTPSRVALSHSVAGHASRGYRHEQQCILDTGLQEIMNVRRD
jgi:hypothetical protein